MAKITANGKNGGSLSLTANVESVTRSGGTVTIRVPWSTSGSGYHGRATIDGSEVLNETGTVNTWPNLNKSGTKTITINNFAGGTKSIALYVYYYQQYAGASNAGSASGSLSATYPAAAFTVSFNANGGATPTASKSVTYGSAYGTLPVPTRTGYTFNGWFTAASGGTQVTAGTTVSITANQTLYAQWTANTYTGTFNLNGGNIGGSSANQTKTQTYDSEWVFPASPVRAGYTFAGWWTAITGGTQITPGTPYSTAGGQTLYAHWTGNTYTCTFDARGGTVSPESKSVICGAAYGELPTPGRSGYTFLGWFTTVNGTTEVKSASTVTATANHTIYAHWEPMSVLHLASDGEVGTITRIYQVEDGTVKQVVGVYAVENGVVKQGV